MLFVTDKFLIFFLIVFVVFWGLPARFRLPFLLGASLFFYASWSFLFMLHFVAVITINYYVMELWRKYPKKWIFVSLQIANVLNIALFKYFYLLADFVGLIFGIDSLRYPGLLLSQRAAGTEIALPLAISFYTFQIMAYGFDIYRGQYTQRHSLGEVALFKSFFPQLIAGPIMRATELLPQLKNYVGSPASFVDSEKFKKGLWLILIGVVKKLLVADILIGIASPILSASVADLRGYPSGTLWIAIISAMLFLYADFSAYSDLARGFGFLLGFEIPINFRAPFFSGSLSEFWRRWHITFSLWIRDYIFIPLGGSKVSEWRIYFNLTLTFFIGGLWHGASYNFALWGILMGLGLSLERYLKSRGFAEMPDKLYLKIPRYAVHWIFFLAIAVMFFAPDPIKLHASSSAESLKWSFVYIVKLFNIHSLIFENDSYFPKYYAMFFSSVGLIFLFHLFEERPALFSPVRRFEKFVLPLVSLVVILSVLEFSGGPKDFFYFQF